MSKRERYIVLAQRLRVEAAAHRIYVQVSDKAETRALILERIAKDLEAIIASK